MLASTTSSAGKETFMRWRDSTLDRVSAAWNEEQDRWIFRRAIGKSHFEAVRLDDPGVIAEGYMEITKLSPDKINAEAAFNTMRARACARAALFAGRPGRR